MKKVINGKAYDTEKAKPVAHWKNWGSWRDFEHIEETLYRKRTGEFFLLGEGGPKTEICRARRSKLLDRRLQNHPSQLGSCQKMGRRAP